MKTITEYANKCLHEMNFGKLTTTECVAKYLKMWHEDQNKALSVSAPEKRLAPEEFLNQFKVMPHEEYVSGMCLKKEVMVRMLQEYATQELSLLEAENKKHLEVIEHMKELSDEYDGENAELKNRLEATKDLISETLNSINKVQLENTKLKNELEEKERAWQGMFESALNTQKLLSESQSEASLLRESDRAKSIIIDALANDETTVNSHVLEKIAKSLSEVKPTKENNNQ